jgi:hypothetical protein
MAVECNERGQLVILLRPYYQVRDAPTVMFGVLAAGLINAHYVTQYIYHIPHFACQYYKFYVYQLDTGLTNHCPRVCSKTPQILQMRTNQPTPCNSPLVDKRVSIVLLLGKKPGFTIWHGNW